jgi:transposase-like protein
MISCKGAHFPQDIILMGVWWYLAWLRSDHDLHCSLAVHEQAEPHQCIPIIPSRREIHRG